MRSQKPFMQIKCEEMEQYNLGGKNTTKFPECLKITTLLRTLKHFNTRHIDSYYAKYTVLFRISHNISKQKIFFVICPDQTNTINQIQNEARGLLSVTELTTEGVEK